jgi:hypothetical protein
MVEGCIASLKVAVTSVLGQMPVAAFGGATEITVGGAQAVALVEKVHTKLFANGLPNVSCAPVVTVPVKRVFSASGLVGVKVAVDCA